MHFPLRTSRRHLLAAAATALCLAAPVAAQSQAYPNKPVRLVVPFPPGGPTDIVARLVGQKLSERMGQPFIVENRPGAGGHIGAEMAVRSPADGYTLLVATSAHAVYPSLMKNVGYSMVKDFTPVSLLTNGPLLIVAGPAMPASNVAEVIALAKAKPGEITFASTGNGTSTQLAGELFAHMAGTKLNHIPYKGSAPGLADVMSGQTQLMFDTMLSALPQVKAGKLRALAVTSTKRSPVAPDVPTVEEAGLQGYEAISWNGLLAPAGTPPQVIERLSAELRTVLATPDVRSRFESQGFAASWTTPADYGRFLGAELNKWAEVIRVAGVKAD